MWQVSDRFLTAIRGPHRIVTVVNVLDGGQVLEGFSALPVVGGQIVRDRTASHFGQGSITVAAPDLAPLGPADALGPAGFEIQVSVGPEFPDGTRELIPVFAGGIQQSTVDAESLTTTIRAFDRSKRVSDAKLTADVAFAAGHNPGAVALNLIGAALAPIPLTWDNDGVAIPTGGAVNYSVGDDPWAIAQSIFAGAGAELFFNGQGTLVGRPEPNVATTSPVFTLDEGDGGMLVEASLTWDREPAANWGRVIGTNTEFDVTYIGTVVDSDPASPSYYGTDDSPSRFGHKPLPVVHSTHVNSTESALAAARALLVAKQGMPRSLSLTSAPNYALVPGDVVTASSQRLGVELPVVIDAITLDLGPQTAMSIDVRARQESEPVEV